MLGKERGLSRSASSSPPDELFSGRERPRVITISGANKDIGKSSLAAYLIRHCRSCAGIKVTVHAERPPGEAVVEEENPPVVPGTDTARMVEAGASPVFWVRTTLKDMAADLGEIWPRLNTSIVVVEGNSVLDHVEPDFAVFIMGPTLDDFKPTAFDAVKKAHTVVINGEKDLSGADVMRLEREVKKMNPHAKLVVVSELGRDEAWEIVLSRAAGRVGGEFMSNEVDEKVMEAVKSKAVEGRITCAVALKLAEELKVPTMEVGKAANALNIKIEKCSLGCF
jgi:LAO/AO transport system kinase